MPLAQVEPEPVVEGEEPLAAAVEPGQQREVEVRRSGVPSWGAGVPEAPFQQLVVEREQEQHFVVEEEHHLCQRFDPRFCSWPPDPRSLHQSCRYRCLSLWVNPSLHPCHLLGEAWFLEQVSEC